jgi:rSAM/selenodomain-associated transferase 2
MVFRRKMRLSVIVPVLNEQAVLGNTLATLRRRAPEAEIIVVDDGSTDKSVDIGRRVADQVIVAPCGRALQQNEGALRSSGDVLAFVHADTLVPVTFLEDIRAALNDATVCGGRFDLALDDHGMVVSLVAKLINLRSRLTRSATGDQAIFVRRAVFESLGSFAQIPICEDIDFMRRLKRAGRVACLRSQVVTSARRWQRKGFFKTIFLMWIIKSLYLLGVAPQRLARWYADVR